MRHRSQQAYIKPSQIDFGDYFGKRIALSSDGNTLAVAAPGNDASVANSGAAFVYGRSGTTWSELLMLKAPNADDNDQLGFDIAISGGSDTVMVGTRGPIAARPTSGAARAQERRTRLPRT